MDMLMSDVRIESASETGDAIGLIYTDTAQALYDALRVLKVDSYRGEDGRGQCSELIVYGSPEKFEFEALYQICGGHIAVSNDGTWLWSDLDHRRLDKYLRLFFSASRVYPTYHVDRAEPDRGEVSEITDEAVIDSILQDLRDARSVIFDSGSREGKLLRSVRRYIKMHTWFRVFEHGDEVLIRTDDERATIDEDTLERLERVMIDGLASLSDVASVQTQVLAPV